MANKTPDEIKEMARRLYIQQWTVAEIAKKIGRSERIIYKWAEVEKWDEFCPPQSIEIINTRRLLVLNQREKKTALEIAEYEMLCRAGGKLAIDLAIAEKIKAEAQWISKNGFIPTAGGGQAKPRGEKKKTVKNDISGVTEEILMRIFNEGIYLKFGDSEIQTKDDDDDFVLFFSYQKKWWDNRAEKTRFILKSRQIGATYYFAYEALASAILKRSNYIFLSASRDQANIFKSYIIAFAKSALDIDIKGIDDIVLSNGSVLRFLSTNSSTSQGYSGNLYVDEVFWIPNFEKLNRVASGMSSQKKWRTTYLSSPSTLNHPAWSMWTGTKYTNRKKIEQFNISHKVLKDGIKYSDGIWRNEVNIEDVDAINKKAIADKLTTIELFDIEELRNKYSKDEFDNLFMCKPIDDSKSVFGLELLLRCIVDADEWTDYSPTATHPYGNKPVAFGFDPSQSGDGSALAIGDMPDTLSKPIRLLNTHKFYGKNYTYQADRVKALVQSHNVQFFGADNTGGTGITMSEKIQAFYPTVTLYHYSPQIKGMLIGKMLDLMENNRFKYLAHMTNVTRAFLLIKQTITASGGATTYVTDRVKSDDIDNSDFSEHGDIAWGAMHMVQFEPVAERAPTTAFIN